MMPNVSDSLVAGGLSGVFTRFLGSPLDVLKVRMQLQIEPTSALQVVTRTLFSQLCCILRPSLQVYRIYVLIVVECKQRQGL